MPCRARMEHERAHRLGRVDPLDHAAAIALSRVLLGGKDDSHSGVGHRAELDSRHVATRCRGERLEEKATIPVTNTAPDIDPDEFLSALDSDTRVYLQLLINGAGKGLNNNGDDLREVFRRLGPTQRSLKKVTGAIADRRTEMRRLISNYGSLLDELGDKDSELVSLVDQ